MNFAAILLLFLSIPAAFGAGTGNDPGMSLDSSFGENGIATRSFGGDKLEISDSAVQADGKLIVSGTVHVGAHKHHFAIARLNPNGSLDFSFGVNGIVRTEFNDMSSFSRRIVVQPDGKILVLGSASINPRNGDSAIVLARYLPDGRLDEKEFGAGGKRVINLPGENTGTDMGLVSVDGKIKILILADLDIRENSSSKFGLLQLSESGALDLSFGDLGIHFLREDKRFATMLVGREGDIWLGGQTRDYEVEGVHFEVVKLKSDGTPDKRFGHNGYSTTPFPLATDSNIAALIEMPNSSVLAVGSANYRSAGRSSGRIAMAQYDSEGRLRSDFGHKGLASTAVPGFAAYPRGAILAPSGDIFVPSYGTSGTDASRAGMFLVARFSKKGELLGQLSHHAGTSDSTQASLAKGIADSEGRLVAVGVAGKVLESTSFSCARYVIEADPYSN